MTLPDTLLDDQTVMRQDAFASAYPQAFMYWAIDEVRWWCDHPDTDAATRAAIDVALATHGGWQRVWGAFYGSGCRGHAARSVYAWLAAQRARKEIADGGFLPPKANAPAVAWRAYAPTRADALGVWRPVVSASGRARLFVPRATT